MIQDVRAALAGLPRLPRVCVIGALGRCGRGSVHILEQSGITGENAALWDMAETKKVRNMEEICCCCCCCFKSNSNRADRSLNLWDLML